MRWQRALAAMAAATLLGFAAGAPAEAGRRVVAPAGEERVVHHHAHWSRDWHAYRARPLVDPFAYRYEPRGYYPYYGSTYWRPAWEMRCRKRCAPVLPEYFPAFGYPIHWHHRAWHRTYHGRHYPWHW